VNSQRLPPLSVLPRRSKLAWALGGVALLSACAAGPTYVKPAVDMPVSWQLQEPWRTASPADAQAKGPWWERFGDADLNALEQKALQANQTLVAAQARLVQARAVVNQNAASQLPQVSLGAKMSELRISANRPLTNYNAPNWSTLQNDYATVLSASYEADLWGRVQSLVDGASASAEQVAADLENTRLVLGADVAVNYFNLRAIDVELDVVKRALALQQSSLALANHRHDNGSASGLDVAQQQALLDTTLTQVDILQRQRAQFEHALATLTGTPAPAFQLAQRLVAMKPPVIPLGIPSDLLERRPDVASAERAMAAANAQIGVAKAAFYPSVIFGPSFGNDSRKIASIFSGPSVLWSMGVSATQTLFDGGRISANVDFSRAGYDITVANYRRVVLTAMQEVEDGLSSVTALDRALVQAQRAVDSNRRVMTIAQVRYEGGVSNYQDMITAQQAQLSSERLATQLLGQRQLASVFLIKALGGDWDAAPSTVPKATQTAAQ
jgi:outer membrane protein, multidrug efflux system